MARHVGAPPSPEESFAQEKVEEQESASAAWDYAEIEFAEFSTGEDVTKVLDCQAAIISGTFNAVVVCDLFTWGLQRDPAARPQSMDEVLAHPFFSSEANEPQRIYGRHSILGGAVKRRAQLGSITFCKIAEVKVRIQMCFPS